ncbi:ChaN family lipoprotein [filamentous cyanobacterium LEGE 11480]|uniref:ChaN family lipoprotein n=1 Tax=Romeriopsis navalis LEGE 11480 TaxID=2777977 RepID=A0A928VQ68_9CYAN|nr:ChaN family lipoprotein [Romeriopsis navalis]MBE9030896.1 ChaN family lipoprotein [Romeriopsis navalis LEGE 11480]
MQDKTNPQAQSNQLRGRLPSTDHRAYFHRISVRFTTLLCLSGLLFSDPHLTPAAIANNLPLQFANHQGQRQSPQQLWQRLRQAQVIYLGETHTNVADHQAQLRLIQALHQRNPRLVIGMEMFQRPYQVAIDRYLAGELNEAELLDRTEYKTRWGFNWELYAPILRYAKAQKIPVVALNTPTEVTRKVGRQGLNRLNFSDRRFIPPPSAVKTAPAAYRQMLVDIFKNAHHGGSSNPDRFERFFQAQVLWDETMAEQITKIIQTNQPETQVAVLVGQGHLIYRYGIPWRVDRRFPKPIKQQVILLSPNTNQPSTDTQGQPIADLLRIPENGASQQPAEPIPAK